MFIYPYKMGSNSARSIRDGLISKEVKARIIRLEGSNFSGGPDKVVINWGNSTPNNEVERCIVLNSPAKVGIASNKLKFFETVKDYCRVPEFTTDYATAQSWSNDGKVVVVREKLTGHSAEGLVILEDPIEFEQYEHKKAKLYVMYISKKQEYRVHIVGGETILVQRKALRSDYPKEAANWRVRNHSNGFIFARNEDKPIPDDVITQAKEAIIATGLDFGAVDVVWNDRRKQAFVLEINSAPGLEGSTADDYINALGMYAQLAKDLKVDKDVAKDQLYDLWRQIKTTPSVSSANLAAPMYMLEAEEDLEEF